MLNSIFAPSIVTDIPKKIALLLYLLLGTTLIAIGSYTFLENPFVCQPVEIYVDFYALYWLAVIQGIMHLFIDLSFVYVLVGLGLLWSAMNYEKSNFNDYLIFTFFLVSTLTHWAESFNELREVNNPIYTFIPTLIMLGIIILKKIKPQY